MPLADYCSPDAILCNLEAADKEDALAQLVNALVASKQIPRAKAKAILNEVIDRERQASTGIGRGIGIPHARSAQVGRIVMAVGRVPMGVDFGAVDGERVRVILLLISPVDRTDEHLAAMRAIVRMARDPYHSKRLHSCTTPESFLSLIREIDGVAS
jgi:mannitol/fructose-specific phosphotransferase system IIA component (Ntr-type)